MRADFIIERSVNGGVDYEFVQEYFDRDTAINAFHAMIRGDHDFNYRIVNVISEYLAHLKEEDVIITGRELLEAAG